MKWHWATTSAAGGKGSTLGTANKIPCRLQLTRWSRLKSNFGSELLLCLMFHLTLTVQLGIATTQKPTTLCSLNWQTGLRQKDDNRSTAADGSVNHALTNDSKDGLQKNKDRLRSDNCGRALEEFPRRRGS